MREMRRKECQISKEKAYEVIKDCTYGVFCTSDEKNTPYGVPISPVLKGNYIYFHCAVEGHKLDNIKQNPTACLTCVSHAETLPEQFSMAYACAIATGTVEIITDEDEKIMALHMICDKYAPHTMEEKDAYILPKLARTGICRLNIENISGKVHNL